MPRYLVVHAELRGDDAVIEADDLTVELNDHWLVISDTQGPCFASPREKVLTVMRVDEEQDPRAQEPAPQKE